MDAIVFGRIDRDLHLVAGGVMEMDVNELHPLSVLFGLDPLGVSEEVRLLELPQHHFGAGSVDVDVDV